MSVALAQPVAVLQLERLLTVLLVLAAADCGAAEQTAESISQTTKLTGASSAAGAARDRQPSNHTSLPLEVSGSPPRPPRAACNVSDGQWRVNPAGPYYDGFTCAQELFQGEMGCANKSHGADFGWFRWHPAACSLPLLDKPLLTQALGRRSLLMVGDSLMRNMFYSMVCLLRQVFGADAFEFKGSEVRVPPAGILVRHRGSPFLVTPPCPSRNSSCGGEASMQKVDASWSAYVSQYDVLLLGSAHWLAPGKVAYAGQQVPHGQAAQYTSSFSGPREAIKRVIQTTALALETQGYAGKVFWLSYSPAHFGKTGNWRHGLCSAGLPLDSTMASVADMDRHMAELHGGELEALPITTWRVVDITTLSLLRPDAHPSEVVHTYRNVSTRADCSHWCLGGVPDTWWEVLVAQLLQEP